MHFFCNDYIISLGNNEINSFPKEAFVMGDVALFILICAMGAYAFYDDLFT